MRHQTIARILNLVADEDQQILNLSVDDARALLLSEDPADVLQIEGSFALLARDGQRVLPGAQPRPAAALLPRQGEGRAGADRGRAHRRRSATSWSARGTATSSTRATRAWCRPITSPSSGSSAAPIRTRSTGASSIRRAEVLPPDLDVIGEAYIARPLRGDAPLAGRACPRPSRSACRSPAASTAARVLLVPLPRAAGRPGRARRGSRRSRSPSTAAATTREQAREFLRRTDLEMLGEVDRRAVERRLDPLRGRRGRSRTTSRSTSSARR